MAGWSKKQRTDIIAAAVAKELKMSAAKVRQVIDAVARQRESIDARTRDQNIRMRRIDELIRQGWSNAQIVEAITSEFPKDDGSSLDRSTIYRDLREAEIRRAPELHLEAKTLQEHAARKFERLQYTAESQNKLAEAISAADKWAKVMGAYAAKKVELSGTVSVSVAVKINAIVGVLDSAGLEALELIQKQVRAAREAGLLTEAVSPLEIPSAKE